MSSISNVNALTVYVNSGNNFYRKDNELLSKAVFRIRAQPRVSGLFSSSFFFYLEGKAAGK
jgi:hypothetical protein